MIPTDGDGILGYGIRQTTIERLISKESSGFAPIYWQVDAYKFTLGRYQQGVSVDRDGKVKEGFLL